MGNYFKKTKSNFMVPHSVVVHPRFKKMPLCAKHVYTILCKIANNNADKDGWFWHGIEQISEKAGLDIRTVSKAKSRLLKEEFINVKRGYSEHSNKRRFDFYQLNGFVFKGDS
ncbi:MAG: hypothetical protein M0R03_19580 [Novosphingobium sp.]|nr:hypothetical protein [Novosphingobium sp.]